ncbi:Endonuclease/exonuclease/phosphatase [Paraphoma chrysanthemicola]|uniref:Endonuclease/exonuclease/phosphatase n=1 Tax=Paraphoma chrysanthemicola TaxID=798071 RepID=A0A8K0RI25_9PLEO|nr:Endonuclease/exonuclease/phosphatase [Paraphoma chrysanthemicola]
MQLLRHGARFLPHLSRLRKLFSSSLCIINSPSICCLPLAPLYLYPFAFRMAAPKSTLTPIQQALTASLNSGPAQKREDAHYVPRQQSYWASGANGSWQSIKPPEALAIPSFEPTINSRAIRLISWNIDVLVPFAVERMRAALQHLDQVVSASPPDVAVVVFLQEMGQSDLQQIRDSQWIKQRFNLTDIDKDNWLSPLYGTTTLVDRRLRIQNVFRVPWITKFDRDGLFVDIALSDARVLRLCNTHLESLVADPPVRPLQLAAAAEYLRKVEVSCALLAGDLNAIQPFDRTLHSENGLNDTYLILGGKEDSDDGFTWGQQVPQWMKDRFGCSRMDKILYRGDILPKKFERIGMGVQVAEDVRAEVEKEIDGGWVTDHYGVMGDFELTGASQLSTWSNDEVQGARSKLS